MRALATVTLALSALVASGAAPAHAGPPQTHGVLCLFAATPDPTAEHGVWVGLMLGGPVVYTEDDGLTGRNGTISCRIVVSDSETAGHDGVGPEVSAHGSTVFTAGPGLVGYLALPEQNVFLCAAYSDDADGITYYWDSPHDRWSTDAEVGCTLAEGSGTGTETDRLVDSYVCPVLASEVAPEGDVADAWDCPPYTPGQETHRVQAAIVLHA